MGFPGGSVVKNPPDNARSTGDMGLIPGLKDLLEKEMAIYSSSLVWEIPHASSQAALPECLLMRFGGRRGLSEFKYLTGSACHIYTSSP